MGVGKPLFYHMAQHGPWTHHVQVKTSAAMEEIEAWLGQQGRVPDTDYEVVILGDKVQAAPKTFTFTPSRGRRTLPRMPSQSRRFVFFFNEAKDATYVKLTWAGR